MIFYIFFNSHAAADPQDNQSNAKITISFFNDTSKTYTVLVDTHQKYVVLQPYSWANNNLGRSSLQAYSIDNNPFVTIQRESDGNFTLNLLADHDHTITFLTKPQFKIITPEIKKVGFSPPSPTNDNWFDADSDVQIIVPYILQSNQENIRQQLSGWSLDNSDINIISRQESGFFKSHIIHMSSMHKIYLDYKNQYYIKVISDFGRTLGSGWYDSGTIVDISIIPAEDIIVRHVFTGWQGSIIGSGSQDPVNVLSDSPKIITANWFVDYTNVSIIGIIGTAVLVSLIIYQKRRA